LARARELLDRFILFDGHNDLPYTIRRAADGDVKAYGLDRVHQESDTDIPRLREGKVGAQVFAAFVPTSVPNPGRFTLEQIAVGLDIEELHADVFRPARRASDIAAARREGRIASVISVESAVGLGGSLSPLRVWYAAGVRILTLCHNETLDWIDSASDAPRHDGITDFGRALVGECNRIGMIVDLAHASPKAQHQVLDATAAPVLWSHSNAMALCPHPRNVPDDVLDRVKSNGGVVMATFVPNFISRKSHEYIDAAVSRKAAETGPWPRGSIPELCDHIAYLVGRTGLAHIGIGSDFFGGPNPPDLADASRFPHLVAELIRRGWSDSALKGLLSGNALRVWRKVEATAAVLRAERPPAILRLARETPR
ncbi:MAG: hypothetical protein FD152_2250, partial [Xanthobacteraceae bacterium]